jgi:hypothetical protein
MTSSDEDLFEAHRLLLNGSYRGDKYELIHRFGDAGFLDAKSTIESYLSDQDWRLRYVALNVLAVHWQCEDARPACERLAKFDPNREVRRLAIAGLGAILNRSRDKAGLAFLLPIIEDPTYPDIRDTAYDAIRSILGYPTYDPAARQLRWPNEIEWSIIEEAKVFAAAR